MKSTWMAGDFGRIAKLNEAPADEFIARRDLKPGLQGLDVACGTGNLAIPAARKGGGG
jgi:2-polyprenyl-3-methyl-5-hydroxy-6-metoxy-1,4-benzoquinol methylase